MFMIHHISMHTSENIQKTSYASDAFELHVDIWTLIAWDIKDIRNENFLFGVRKVIDVMERHTTSVPTFDQGLLPEISP
jgi:hypothetical protein